MVNPSTFLQGWISSAPEPQYPAIWCALPVKAWIEHRKGACVMDEAQIFAALNDAGNLFTAMLRCAGGLGLTRAMPAQTGDIAIVRYGERGHVFAIVASDDADPLVCIATADRVLVIERLPIAACWKF